MSMLQHQVKAIEVNGVSREFKVRGNKAPLRSLFNPQWQIVKAIENLDLSIEQSESVAFLGPNGAGKTTTIKMLTGLMFPTQGSIKVLNYTPQERKHEFLKKIGLVMGNKSGLNWDLSPKQSFDLLRLIYDLDEDSYTDTVNELSELLRVSHVFDRQVRRLSLGERMKVELIGAVLHQPKVLFLDEPTIGLDIDAKNAVREFVRYLQKEKDVTVLLTSHDMLDVAHICDRAVIVDEGKKIYDGSLIQLEAKYADLKYIDVYSDKNLDINNLGLKNISNSVEELKAGHWRIEAKKQNSKEVMGLLLSEENVDDIRVESVDLDRIMRDVFKKQKSK